MNDPRSESIWLLVGSLEVGGTEHTLVDLANGLVADGCDITVWTITGEDPLAADFDTDITYRTLNAGGKCDIRAPISFLRHVRRACPTYLQSFLFFDNALARLAGVVSPSTTVITGVRAVPTNPSRVRTLIDRSTMALSDHVVSNSKAGAELAIQRGAPVGSVSIIHNGRELDEFADPEGGNSVRSEFDIPAEDPVVGSVGRLIRRKGHHDLITAWHTISETHPDAHLLLVGDGPRKSALEKQAVRLGVDNRVHFAGVRDDIPTCLDAMDVFAFPSYFEGLPGAVIEAMAAGRPIVATAVDGNVELLTDEETGLLVQADDPQALGSSISELLTDRQLATRLGQRANAVATQKFSLSAMVDSFKALYADLAQDRAIDS